MVKKVILNTFIYILGSGVSQIFSLIFTLILMQELTIVEYGKYNLIISLVAIFSFVIDGGLTGYIIKEFNNRSYQLNTPCLKRDEFISNVYVYQFLVTFFLMFTYTVTAYLIVDNSVLHNYLTFGLLTLLLGIATPTFALLVANEKKYVVVLKDVVIAVLRLALLYFIFRLSFSSDIIYWIPSLALIVALILICYFYKKILIGFSAFYVHRGLSSLLLILKSVSPFLILSLFNIVYNKIDVLMLNSLSNINEVAFYAGATIFVYPFMFICSAASSAILPYFSRRKSGLDSGEKDDNIIFIFMLILGFLVSFILFIFSDLIYKNLFDGKYLLSSDVYKVLVWYLFIVFGYTSISNSLISQGKIYILIYMNVTMLILNVLLNYTLIPLYGAKGAAFSTVISEVIIIVFLLWFMKFRELRNA